MPALKSNAEGALATLCEAIELAQAIAGELPAEGSPSYDELMEALTCARVSTLRIAAELMRTQKRLER